MNFQGSDGGVATEANKTAWVKAFQRASMIFKKVQPRFKIVFNPNLGPSSQGLAPDGSSLAQADEVWPGDAYVDVVGVDVYDQWEPYTDDASWQWHYAGLGGLNHWMQFSYAHNKPLALPEWGLSGGDYHHGGDNPKFINYLYTYLQANKGHIAYESYYDDFGPSIGAGMNTLVNSGSFETYKGWLKKLSSQNKK